MAINEMIVLEARNLTTAMWRQLESDAKRATSSVLSTTEQLNKGLQASGTALTAVGAAGGALLVSSTMLAARVETLGAVLYTVGENAGYSREQLDAYEEAVKAQGITTQATRTTLIKLAQAHIDLAQASDLARIAQDAAVIAGINSSEAYDRMIHGITTLNPLILRRMGLIVDAQAEYEKYAATVGMAATDLDAMTKQQIFTNAVMKAGEGITGAYGSAMETAGKKLTSMPRHIEEARVALGELFLPVMVEVIDSVTSAVKAFNALSDSQKAVAGYSIAAGTGLAAILGPLMLLASKLPTMAAGLSTFGQGLQTVMLFGSTTATVNSTLSASFVTLGGAAAGALAVFAGAAVLVSWAIALGMIVKTVKQVKEGFEAVEAALEEHEASIIAGTDTWEEYVDEMLRVAVLTGQISEATVALHKDQIMLTGSFDSLIPLMGRYADNAQLISQGTFEAIRAGQALAEQDNIMINTAQRQLAEINKVNEGYYDQATEVTNLNDEYSQLNFQFNYGKISSLEFADGLRAIQEKVRALGVDGELATVNEEFLKLFENEAIGQQITAALTAEMGTLNDIVAGEVGSAIEQHTEKIDELTEAESRLNQEISDLVAKQEKQGYLNRSDRENMAQLEEDLGAVEGAIRAENAAWAENAKQLMFNLAQRQLLADGIQEGDVEALGIVAESLGIVDENTADAFAGLDHLGGMLSDGSIDAEAYAAGVQLLADNIAAIPSEKYITLYVNQVMTGGLLPAAPLTGSGGGVVGGEEEDDGLVHYEAMGGSFLVREPTLFMAGDRGLEYVDFKPMMGGYDPVRAARVDPGIVIGGIQGRSERGNAGPGNMNYVGGDTVNNYNYNSKAAAVAMALTEERKMVRLNKAMGG